MGRDRILINPSVECQPYSVCPVRSENILLRLLTHMTHLQTKSILLPETKDLPKYTLHQNNQTLLAHRAGTVFYLRTLRYITPHLKKKNTKKSLTLDNDKFISNFSQWQLANQPNLPTLMSSSSCGGNGLKGAGALVIRIVNGCDASACLIRRLAVRTASAH